MHPAGPAASRPGAALHLRDPELVGFDGHRLLLVGSTAADLEALCRGGALGVEPDDGVATNLDSATWSVWFSPTSWAWMLSCIVLVIAPLAPIAATRRLSWVLESARTWFTSSV